MTSRDFCFWLQGYFELRESSHQGPIGEVQAQRIRDHLNLVFKHEIDPSMGPPARQAELNEAHAGVPKHMRPSSDPHIRC